MSSESSPKDRRGKTTLHGVKATPKAMRPVQPEHVYDSYEIERSDRHDRLVRREERRARRSGVAPDLSTYGMFAFFAVLGLGVVFFLVQGGSTMEFNRVEETQEEIRAKNELTRKLNEERAREAASRPQPALPTDGRDANIPARQPVIPPAERVAPRAVAPQPAVPNTPAQPAVSEPAGEAAKGGGGGISAGMVPPELQKKLSTEPRTTVPDEMKK